MITPELVAKYYKFPFSTDGYALYLWDDAHHMCAMCSLENRESRMLMKKLVQILNGEKLETFNSGQLPFTLWEGEIQANGRCQIIIREWGRLSYIKEDDPETIQNTFAQYLTELLNEATNTYNP